MSRSRARAFLCSAVGVKRTRSDPMARTSAAPSSSSPACARNTSVARVAYGAGAFLIVTRFPTQIYFSADVGDTWTTFDPFGTGGGYFLEDILYWSGAYYGVGGDYVYPSPGHIFRSGDL